MAYKKVEIKQPLPLLVLPYLSVITFFVMWELSVRTRIVPDMIFYNVLNPITFAREAFLVFS